MLWFIYRIDCKTPNHVYIGQTRSLPTRINDHRRGHGSAFTKQHGVKSWRILAVVRTEEEARAREQEEMGRASREGYSTYKEPSKSDILEYRRRQTAMRKRSERAVSEINRRYQAIYKKGSPPQV